MGATKGTAQAPLIGPAHGREIGGEIRRKLKVLRNFEYLFLSQNFEFSVSQAHSARLGELEAAPTLRSSGVKFESYLKDLGL
jgi:hypothetical protein